MGMPPRVSDTWAYERERQRLARRRRRDRRRRRMLWLLTCVTTVVLLFIALMIKEMAKLPTVASNTALSVPAKPSHHASVRAAVPGGNGSSRPEPAPSYPRVTDYSSGLSYRLFGSPWHRGCPSVLNTPMFSWTAGENAVAGHVLIGGSAIDWHANACSGQLQQQWAYSGPADLETTATSLVGALDPAYYAGVQHILMITDSSPMLVSGNQAWAVRFQVTYSDGASQGLTWTSESGAVVVVDRGPDHVPAVFYVSVPGDLDASDVDTLVGSLRVTG
jgi:hypothetical protein